MGGMRYGWRWRGERWLRPGRRLFHIVGPTFKKPTTYQRKTDPADFEQSLATSEGPVDLLGVGN